MKFITALLFPIIFCSETHATDVSGHISANTTWDLAGSPYIVIDDVFVDAGITLTINPGVDVKFDSSKALVIGGTIRAIGDASNIISFESSTPLTTEFTWSGIYLATTAKDFNPSTQEGCFFKYCSISNAGAVSIYPSPGYHYTIYSEVSLGFDHSTIKDSNCGLVAQSGSGVSNSFFLRCTSDAQSGSTIKVGQNSVVFNNLFYDNTVVTSAGMVSTIKNIKVYNNLFIRNLTVPVFSEVTFNLSDSCQFYGNTVVDDSYMIIKVGGASVYNNTFNRNLDNAQTILSTLSDCSIDFHDNNIISNSSATHIPPDSAQFKTATGNGSTLVQNNYWGITEDSDFNKIIYDGNDLPQGAGLCKLTYSPFDSFPALDAPVIPPVNVIKHQLTDNIIRVSWTPNTEKDLKGYNVYWGGYTGYSFTNSSDAGTETFFDITGESIDDVIGVTAYDQEADHNIDMYEGHESWYGFAKWDSLVGISENLSSVNSISVFPNPSDKYVTVKLPITHSPLSLLIYDVNGRKVSELDTTNQSTVSFLLNRPGVYYMTAVSDSAVFGFQKIIIVQ